MSAGGFEVLNSMPPTRADRTPHYIKVLLVEDNPGDARLTREMLHEAAGDLFTITHVERLSMALKRLDQETFDAILLDLLLLDTYGIETLHQIRASRPRIPVIVLSGMTDEGLALEALQHGAQDFLIKGVITGDAVARVIRYGIERARAEYQQMVTSQDSSDAPVSGLAPVVRHLSQRMTGEGHETAPWYVLFLFLDPHHVLHHQLNADQVTALREEVQGRLPHCLRTNDVVSFPENYEVSISLHGPVLPSEFHAMTAKILSTLSTPLVLGEATISLTPTLGFATYPLSEKTSFPL